MMDYQKLADVLFPTITTTPEDMEKRYPERSLPEGAKVTRMAPSPTGFMHLGNLYGALVDERLAHQSGGVFYLRIEDTDQKRLVENGVAMILEVFDKFGLQFDEGAGLQGDTGIYGPYHQSRRAEIYQTYVKYLVSQGKAYPCFCTEEELEAMRARQEANKENYGYYGAYAKCRNLSLEEIEAKIAEGKSYVIRFRSEGSADRKIIHQDLVKGKLELTENDQDVVILKSDGLPTYHFAHVVDDHLMRTTHVVRGEEWLPTLPIHLQLFDAMGWKRPKYIHTAQMMKMDGTSKRKLSKRKDPEFALEYYFRTGIPIAAAVEYLLTLLNSNFEEWRMANPTAPIDAFKFTTNKMSGSGALFDMDKLQDVCKNVVSRMSADEVYAQVLQWSEQYDPDFAAIFGADEAYSKAILGIGRGGKKPRKDFGLWSQVKDYVSFFFDSLFTPDYTGMPANLDAETIGAILRDYRTGYAPSEDANSWFDGLKELCPKYGLAADMKAYKADPSAYRGNVADLSMVLRVAICGRTNAPDLYTVMTLLDADKVRKRLQAAEQSLAQA
jgi:glutamyl-tRNA synthetase